MHTWVDPADYEGKAGEGTHVQHIHRRVLGKAGAAWMGSALLSMVGYLCVSRATVLVYTYEVRVKEMVMIPVIGYWPPFSLFFSLFFSSFSFCFVPSLPRYV